MLLVNKATVETGVEKSWMNPRAQLLVLLVKSATLERPVDVTARR